ncbi:MULTISPECIES: thiamine pyrophosphate-binding protein [Amycolatopsis]|uniref:thiamine pyrophosphate-binding protein n=1 Tax=Amycolatopsis TaxID=1813 RepID=UPI000569941E|nr:thiamine pyrophosphate-binding protein [Amycolatopsis nivea]
MRGSDVVLEVLRTEGVRHVFGNPGTTELPLMTALSAARDPRYVLGLQESSVVAMADGCAQATGRPAMANLHAMAGLGNAVGNLTNAVVQRTPLVITAGQADQRHLVQDPLLSGDLAGLAAPVAKWTHEVRRVEDLGVVLRRAFRDAASEPTGPVFVSLPVDVLEAEDPRGARAVPPRSPVERGGCAPRAAELARLLCDVPPDQVAVVAGDEVAASGAVDALTGFAEAAGARVFGSSLHATTVFPTTHPLWAGQLGLSTAEVRDALAGFKRVLLLGGRVFMAYGYSGGDFVAPGTELLQVAPDPHQLARSVPVRLGVSGDLRCTLEELTAKVALLADGERAAKELARAGEVRAEAERAAEDGARARYAEAPMAPVAAVHAVLRALPDDVVVVDESMSSDVYVRRFHRAGKPGRYFAARGGGLGWGMPAAAGVCIGRGLDPVVCFVGDGSAMYSPQALWTAAHERLPVLFVVVNNCQYLMLKDNLRGRVPALAGQGRLVGMDLVEPRIDFVALAGAMGVKGVVAESPGEAADAAAMAWRSGEPYVVELRVGVS